jgi:hypothetical protein
MSSLVDGACVSAVGRGSEPGHSTQYKLRDYRQVSRNKFEDLCAEYNAVENEGRAESRSEEQINPSQSAAVSPKNRQKPPTDVRFVNINPEQDILSWLFSAPCLFPIPYPYLG